MDVVFLPGDGTIHFSKEKRSLVIVSAVVLADVVRWVVEIAHRLPCITKGTTTILIPSYLHGFQLEVECGSKADDLPHFFIKSTEKKEEVEHAKVLLALTRAMGHMDWQSGGGP